MISIPARQAGLMEQQAQQLPTLGCAGHRDIWVLCSDLAMQTWSKTLLLHGNICVPRKCTCLLKPGSRERHQSRLCSFVCLFVCFLQLFSFLSTWQTCWVLF